MRCNQVSKKNRYYFQRPGKIGKSRSGLCLRACGWLFLLAVGIAAQISEPATTVRGNKTLVKIPVVVSDRDGRRVSGLKKEDFAVFQNEQKQNVVSFSAEDEPISIALLIDTSRSTQNSLHKIKEAAQDFIEILRPNDQCLIATFDSKVNILNPLTSDRDSMKEALKNLRTGEVEGTVMFNAIKQMLSSSFAGARHRKAIVLLSDGKDYGSDIARTELLNELEESDLSIYAIFYQSGIGFDKPVINANGTVTEAKIDDKPKVQKRPKVKKKGYTILIPLSGETFTQEEIKLLDKAATTDALNSLKEMTDLTAGRFYMSDAQKLSSIFKQVAGELRQVYLIGLEVPASDSAAKNFTVRVDRPAVVVSTRNRLVAN
jgi:Ca-activated chloride channel family protein